ncbi:MAG TPA: phosphoenolpyruvate--protein phosphotransferase [Pseudomonadales bacterium]|nr:phosphoenolpyruvate--protein phosphotransferase [Pseudomonadales bacterium]
MLSALRKVVQEVNAAANLEQALWLIVQRVRAEMTTQVCSIYLLDTASQRYILMATEGLNRESVGRVSLGKDEGLVGLVATREEPINLQDAESHPQYRYFPETGEERFRSFLGTPIIHLGKVLGVLVVQQVEQRKFDESEESFLVTLSAQLAAVIAHAEATGSLNQVTLHGYRPPEATFQGVCGAQGVAIGEVAVIYPAADLSGVQIVTTDNIETELGYFNAALCRVRRELQQLSSQLQHRLREEERALFDVYIGMLTDNALGGEIVNRIVNESLQARSALAKVILEHVRTFEAMDDAYLRERAADVRDLGLRVLAALDQQNKREKRLDYPPRTILVGEELTASMLGEVPEDRLVGLISVRGSGSSHVAILARAMGIPTVMGVVDLPYQQLDGRNIVLDAYRGRVYTNPSAELRYQFEEIWREEQQFSREYHALTPLPSITLDGQRQPLWVNTGLMTDVVRSLDRGAEGVGLYRTEISFLLKDRFPSEEEQRNAYREQLSAFSPNPVTMRTLDIGGDKSLPYFPIKEENPFLGWRGIRVSLDHPEIFLVQVRAMLKASEDLDNLRIMLPMISSVQELEQALKLVQRAWRELLEEGYNIVLPQLGAMIEVPAAVYQARELARRVDFLSVGTNDLTQYLLAVDRNNPRVAGLYHSFHPAVLRALTNIVEDVHAEGKTVSVCGEMAGDPSAAVLLMAMGYDVLSMNANNLPKVKSVIRAIHMSDARKLLAEVMAMHDTRIINEHVRDTLTALGINPRLLHSKTDA